MYDRIYRIEKKIIYEYVYEGTFVFYFIAFSNSQVSRGFIVVMKRECTSSLVWYEKKTTLVRIFELEISN